MTNAGDDKGQTYELVSPVPTGWCDVIWSWLTEYPSGNFLGEVIPTREQFGAYLMSIAGGQSGEIAWGVLRDGAPLAVMFYRPNSPDSLRVGGLTVLCPARAWAMESLVDAVGDVLGRLMWNGAVKIQLPMFADDSSARRFWLAIGAVEEGVLRRQALRDGTETDVRLLALFRPNDLHAEERVGRGAQDGPSVNDRAVPAPSLVVTAAAARLNEERDRLLVALTTERGTARFLFRLDAAMGLAGGLGHAIDAMRMSGQPDGTDTAH